MGFRIDLTDDDETTVERGAYLPEGWYLAKLEDVSEDNKNGNAFLHFAVTAGAYKGDKLKEKVWNPDNSDDDSKAKKSANRIKMLASRLGIIKKDDFGREAEIDFADGVGTEVVIHVREREYEKRDQDTGEPTGEKGKASELYFDGVYPLDHPKIKPEVRKMLGLPPANVGAADDAVAAPARKGAAKQTTAAAAASPAVGRSLDVDDL